MGVYASSAGLTGISTQHPVGANVQTASLCPCPTPLPAPRRDASVCPPLQGPRRCRARRSRPRGAPRPSRPSCPGGHTPPPPIPGKSHLSFAPLHFPDYHIPPSHTRARSPLASAEQAEELERQRGLVAQAAAGHRRLEDELAPPGGPVGGPVRKQGGKGFTPRGCLFPFSVWRYQVNILNAACAFASGPSASGPPGPSYSDTAPPWRMPPPHRPPRRPQVAPSSVMVSRKSEEVTEDFW